MFDVVAIHPYTYEVRNVLRIVRYARRALREAGDGNRPLWLTEVTWSSGKRPGHPAAPFETTPADQAARLAEALPLLIRERHKLGIERIFWENWISADSNHANPFDFAGPARAAPGRRWTRSRRSRSSSGSRWLSAIAGNAGARERRTVVYWVSQNGRRSTVKAVRFDRYGGIDVLQVIDVEPPTPVEGEVLVRVKAAGINPGEAAIREGLFAGALAGDVPVRGGQRPGRRGRRGRCRRGGFRGRRRGDRLHAQSGHHAELVVVEAQNLRRGPAQCRGEAAGSLFFMVGATAYAAVRAVSLADGDVVAISGAAGGVGTLAVQLARNAGATVIGLAGEPHHDWLREHGAIPVTYGDGVAERIRDAGDGRLDAFIDTFGSGTSTSRSSSASRRSASTRSSTATRPAGTA